MRQRISQLTTFMDRPGSLGRYMRRNSSRKRELPKKLAQTIFIPPNIRIDLRISPLQIGIRDQSRTTMPRAGDKDGIQVSLTNKAIHVRVYEIQPRSRPPVAK